jgi:hypothetical protein
MGKISKWFPPFCGLLAVALGIGVAILIGQGEDATKKTAQEIVTHYKDKDTENIIGSVLIAFVAIAMLYFGGWLRRFLRDAEGPDGILSAVAFGGAVAFAGGAAVAASVHWALADLADDISPVALQAINGIDYDLFLFFPVGLSTVVLATGISAVRHGALPKWFAWTGVVLGALGYTPGFFFVYFLAPLGPLWIVILSIMGMRRAVAEPAPAAA